MIVPLEKLLVRAGLARVDGRIYAVLSKSGSGSVADICRRTGLHRPTVYRSLPRLAKAGLVRGDKRGKRVLFATTDPERLERLLVKTDGENARSTERLTAIFGGDGVTVLRGRKGLAMVLEDVTGSLGRDDVFYRITSRKSSTDVEGFVPKDYRAKRDAKKIQQFVITNAGLRASTYKKRTDCLSKAVPRDGDPFEYDIALVIYGDKVAVVDYAERRATVTKNARLAKFHARMFRLLFDRL